MDSAWTVCPISDPAPTNEKKNKKNPVKLDYLKSLNSYGLN